MDADLTPCNTCPFKALAAALKQEAVETGDEMLCHESQCLDGDRPDRRCAGFYQESVRGR